MHRFSLLFVLLSLSLLVACGDDDSSPDASGEDAAADTTVADDASEDATVPDASGDATVPDASEDATVPDAAEDAAADASPDASPDAGEDAAVPDASEDTGRPDRVCGTRGGVACEADEYCDYTRLCGRADGGGRCTVRPEFCPEDCPGVCGCDGNFYCNACVAASGGVDVDPDAECGPSDCDAQDIRGAGPCAVVLGYRWTGRSCAAVSGCSCEGADCGDIYSSPIACGMAHEGCAMVGPDGCRSNADCDAADYCDLDSGCGAADERGSCSPRPEGCAGIFDPVCGCDGMTYGNSCSAAAEGVNVFSRGEC